MPPTKRKQTYDRSDSFTVSDDHTPPPTSKRSKPTSSNSTSKPASKQIDADRNPYWPISTARRVTISDFKGKKMVSVREYYEKDGTWLPGKKGITMTVEQYSALVALLPQIERALGREGEGVGRPDYGLGDEDGHGDGDEDGDADADGSVKGEEGDHEDAENGGESDGRRSKKANIDATSDEDED